MEGSVDIPLSVPNNQLDACVTSMNTAIIKMERKINESFLAILWGKEVDWGCY